MKVTLVQTLGGSVHVEHRTGGTNGPVLGYHFLGGTTQSHSWEIPCVVQPGDSLRLLWGTNPTWQYVGSPYVIQDTDGTIQWYRVSAAGPSGSMTVGVLSEARTATEAWPDWFNVTSADMVYWFGRGMSLGFVAWFAVYLVKWVSGSIRNLGKPPHD